MFILTKRAILVTATLLTLGGCVSVPEPLQTQNTNLVSYEQVVSEAVADYSQARWGGVIASVDNLADKSVIEIVHYPLKSSGRPNLRAESIGRFKAVVNEFIDPLVFKQERVISVLGQVSQPIEGNVQEQAYTYPALAVSGYHLWEDIQDIEVTRVYNPPFYRFGHGFGYHLGFPHYRVRHYSPFIEQERIRIRSGNEQGGTATTRHSDTTRQNDTLPEPNIPPPKPFLRDKSHSSTENPKDRNR